MSEHLETQAQKDARDLKRLGYAQELLLPILCLLLDIGILGYFLKHHWWPKKENFRAWFLILSKLNLFFLSQSAIKISEACLIFFGAYALGDLLLSSLNASMKQFKSNSEYHFYSLGVGLGSISLLLFLLGIAGLWYRWILIGAILAPAALWLSLKGKNIPTVLRSTNLRAKHHPIEILAAVFLGGFVLLNFLAASGPDVFYDCLVYHLALPQLYLLWHRIIPTPTILYSAIPQGTEMLFGLAMAMQDGTLANIIHLGFGLATTALIFHWLDKRSGRFAAWMGALLFYTASFVCFESWFSMIELAWTFYIALAVLALHESLQEKEQNTRRGWVLLAGIFIGFSIGTKYNALLSLPVLTVTLWACEHDKMDLLKRLCMLWAAALLVSSPWFIKNVFYFHNPIYPFLNNFFPTRHTGINLAAFKSDASFSPFWRSFGSTSAAASALRGFFRPFEPGMFVSDYAGLALTLGTPWVLAWRSEKKAQRFLFVSFAFMWASWALYSRMPRFLLYVFPILCILIALSLAKMKPILRASAAALLAYGFVLNFSGLLFAFYHIGMWRVPLGAESRAQYLSHWHPYYPNNYYAAINFINKDTPENATILFLGESRGYYCKRKFITASVFDTNPIDTFANGSQSGEELFSKVRKAGISYILINMAGTQWQSELSQMTKRGSENFLNFSNNHMQLVWSNKIIQPDNISWTLIYKIF